MLFGLAHEFQEAYQLSGPAWRGRLGSRSQRPAAQTELKAAGGVAGDGENPVNVQPEDTFNMDESGLYYGQQPSRTLARGRTAGNKKDKKRMTVA
jgi:hypothetical protein